MKRTLQIVALMLASMTAFTQTTTTATPSPEVKRGAYLVQRLHDTSRNPDSFVLTGVYIRPNKNGPRICVSFRSQNGLGAVMDGLALMVPRNGGGENLFLTNSNFVADSWTRKSCQNTSELVDITSDVDTALGIVVSKPVIHSDR